MPLAKTATAEAVGTALLLAIVVGSGIMADRLAEGNAAVALLANAVATGAGLYVLIVMFGPVSGAHINPVITVVLAWNRELPLARAAAYIAAQIGGAVVGVMTAHAMFGLPILQVSGHMRSTAGEGLGEVVATFGLVLVVLMTSRFRGDAVPMMVAAYITSAYWFTSSTSFANPAVTLARALSDTFAGIAPASVPLFIAGQFAGAFGALYLSRWLAMGAVVNEPSQSID